jgi:hypothetical protein
VKNPKNFSRSYASKDFTKVLEDILDHSKIMLKNVVDEDKVKSNLGNKKIP